jgi:plastocyanin
MSLRFSRRALLAMATATLAAAALTACGGASHTASKAAAASPALAPAEATPAAQAPVATSAVTIDNFAFQPGAITIQAGTTVAWTNTDEEPHSVVSADEPMHSPTLAGPTNTFTHTFTKPGTYAYNCGIHPFMHGTVEVTA